MADKDSKKDVKIPLLVKKENVASASPVGEEDQTVKIPKPSLKKKSDDKKVVLNSATDSTIRPSDATTMAPAVEMRKTETGNVEIIDSISPSVAKTPLDAGGASKTPPPMATEASENKGRKTIRLKPLKKNAISNDNADETISMDRDNIGDDNADETISMDRGTIDDENLDETLSFKKSDLEDDNSDETLSMDRSTLMEDMPSISGDAPVLEDESTVKIQKPKMSKPAAPAAARPPAPSSSSPSTPIIPGAKETIKLRPSTGAGKVPITLSDKENEDTVSVSKKTIRLVPKKAGDDDSTQKTSKLQATTPKPSAPTVKLQQPVEDVTQKTPRPSAPTIKLGGNSDDVTQKIGITPNAGAAVEDITQKTARPAAPTVKLPDISTPGASVEKTDVSSKKTLKLKSNTPAPAAPPSIAAPPGDAPSVVGGDDNITSEVHDKSSEPNIIMTLVAVLALIAISYYTWMVAGQWAELHQGLRSANVPSLSGTVK